MGLGCEEAAITALKASRFVPAKRGKAVVSQRLRIPYRFQFKKLDVPSGDLLSNTTSSTSASPCVKTKNLPSQPHLTYNLHY